MSDGPFQGPGWDDLQAGGFAPAAGFFLARMKENPLNPLAHLGLGLAFEGLGEMSRAEQCLRRAMELAPNGEAATPARTGLGRILAALGRWAEAERPLREALAAQSDNPEARFHLARVLTAAGRLEEAEMNYRALAARFPDNRDVTNNLGNLLADMGRREEAILCFDAAIAADANYVNGYFNRGDLFLEQGDLDRAEADFRQVLVLDPGHVPAAFHMALLQWERGDGAAALAGLEALIGRAPDDAALHLARSRILLALGRFDEGWRAYEWRFRAGEPAPRFFKMPVWDGAPLGGAKLLAVSEQGVGDEIFFSAGVAALAEAGESVALECDDRLKPLFARSFPAVDVLGRIDPQTPERLPPVDLQVPLGSLPGLGWMRRDGAPYLQADPDAVAAWAERLAGWGAGKKIGLSWRGGRPEAREARSIPLAAWAPLFEAAPEARWINLQYDWRPEELEGVPVRRLEGIDPKNGLDGLAALMGALDLVICVDNATLHLAGALGVPAWGLLPRPADWRWGLEGVGSERYGAVRLFRQAEPGTWGPVLAAAALALADV